MARLMLCEEEHEGRAENKIDAEKARVGDHTEWETEMSVT